MLPLGSGAFGEVHLAWDKVDSRWVAVKRFTGQDELGLLRMVIESRIRVSHPHLVKTVAFRLVDDRAWLVTELARGGSLRGLVARTGALPWGWVVEAVDQILSALTALHATGVVHRDLKPANLLLGSVGAQRPHLLVGDFGIATWRTVSMTGIGAAIGTPGYLAPEYLDGQQPSPATDLFAVGVLAAELLAGRRLIHYSNASPTLPSSWTDALPMPAEVPRQVAAVLQRMAAPDPSWRFRDCTEARDALVAAAPPGSRGDLTVVATPDLLASVPPGWTPDGPEQPTETLSKAPAETTEPADLVGLPIDGGPTELVVDEPATVATPARGPATQPPLPTTGSPNPPTTPETGSATSPKATRKAARRAALLVALLILAGGAGTLWWAATHRTIPGHASATGSPTGEPDQTSRWTPTIVAPCSKVEQDRERQGVNGTERCQRTQTPDAPQHWVERPPGGFPKSDASGPFPGESCAANGDTAYSPVGDHVECTENTWQVIA